MARDFCQCGFLVPGLSARPCIRGESVGSSVCLCVCACVYTNSVYTIYIKSARIILVIYGILYPITAFS